jgi:hypothetical protein
VRDNVNVAGQSANFIAMQRFGPRQVAKHCNKLRVVVRFHLFGQEIVARDRIGLDLERDSE